MAVDEPSARGDHQDWTTLPPPVSVTDTRAAHAADPVPDPHAGRNVDQHLALRDD